MRPIGACHGHLQRECIMLDLVYLVLGLGFSILMSLYALACERL
ncbi:hypothetical protein QNA08_03630 [Chelatococcus sp. SYSU_G07232]|uniref:Uncharacterized protein n=1 Tax=Chelatococcus albus TaxID=3047466 RepID=A0ABT7ADB3_9HYPH|nr:hypothetical protein [Chelatococcus sp. SYSU_G07232]MDJ1157328.1 hypothetical protein [Chelatococcus sp. SYSU_G07232]